MLTRTLIPVLHRAVHLGGPVLLEGPRGSGKTTLLRDEFRRLRYVTLEDASDRRAARGNPALLLARLRGSAVIDDIHRAPELIAHLAQQPDPGPVIVASSRRLSLPFTTLRLFHPTIAELAGRLPLSLEMLGRFVPAPARSPLKPAAWPRHLKAIEHDVRELVSFRDLDRFEAFVQTASEVSGEILDQQELAYRSGTSRTTVSRWLAVLEACFMTIRIKPCDFDFCRRLVRSPKLHFLDSPRFESSVVSQLYRNAAHSGQTPDLRYWRDSNGFEIPLVLQPQGSHIMPVSIAETPTPSDSARLQRWMNLAGIRSAAMISRHFRDYSRGAVLSYTLDQL